MLNKVLRTEVALLIMRNGDAKEMGHLDLRGNYE